MWRAIPVGLLTACVAEEPSATTPSSESTDAIPLDHGVRGRCRAPRTGGFDPFFAQAEAKLVHGTSPREVALAEDVLGWYSDAIALTAVPVDELGDDRSGAMWILGTSAHPLLQELGDDLPVWFEPERFTFAGHRWEERGHAIAMTHPSPWDDAQLLIVAGNTPAGAHAPFTVFTGAEDVVVVRGRGADQIRGDLCHDGPPWTYKPSFAEDTRDDWDAFLAGRSVVESAHHVYTYEPGGDFAADVEWMPQWQDDRYLAAVDVLEIPPLDFPVTHHLYDTRADKTEVTGESGNAHANALNAEVHALYGEGIYAVGAHEDVHVLTWYGIGDAGSTLFGEGTAVMVDDSWQGRPLSEWAAKHLEAGDLPALADLVDDFWGAGGGGDLGYGAAGHFVSWLRATHGLAALKAIYVRGDLRDAFVDELGQPLSDVEADWHASIDAG